MSKPATLKDAQEAVHQWISQWEEGYFSPLSNLARLTEELGELARAINLHHGDKPPKNGQAPPRESIAEEIGDLLFVLITLSNSLEIDLEEALQSVMKKYDLRDAHRFTPKE